MIELLETYSLCRQAFSQYYLAFDSKFKSLYLVLKEE